MQLLSLIYFRTFEGVIDEPSKEYAFSYIDTRLDMFERMSNNVWCNEFVLFETVLVVGDDELEDMFGLGYVLA